MTSLVRGRSEKEYDNRIEFPSRTSASSRTCWLTPRARMAHAVDFNRKHLARRALLVVDPEVLAGVGCKYGVEFEAQPSRAPARALNPLPSGAGRGLHRPVFCPPPSRRADPAPDPGHQGLESRGARPAPTSEGAGAAGEAGSLAAERSPDPERVSVRNPTSVSHARRGSTQPRDEGKHYRRYARGGGRRRQPR